MKKNLLILMLALLMAALAVGCSVDQIGTEQANDEVEMSKVSILPQISYGTLLKVTNIPSITGGLFELLVDVDNQKEDVVFKASTAKTKVTLKVGNIEEPVRIDELRRGDKLVIISYIDVDGKPFATNIKATRVIF